MFDNHVPRRALLAWCAVLSLGGCAEDEATKIAKDPYLPTMMKDPLYTWRPAGDLSRTEALLPRSTDNLASGTAMSSIVITFTFLTSADPHSLLLRAQEVAANAGYIGGTRVLMAGVNIGIVIGILKDSDGLSVILTAPV